MRNYGCSIVIQQMCNKIMKILIEAYSEVKIYLLRQNKCKKTVTVHVTYLIVISRY